MVVERPIRIPPLAAGCVAIVALAMLAGCGGSSRTAVQPARHLTADDFRSAEAAGGPPAPIPVYAPERPVSERVEIRTLSEAEARGEIGEVDVSVGEPRLEASAAQGPGPAPIDPGTLELVDANVGDLNGRPILASTWLESRGARLRAESAGKSRAEWRAFAAEEIQRALVDDLTNELFLAEARSALTPEQKAGLRTFLRRFERDVVRSHYGSQTLADLQMRQTWNMSLEEAKRDHERTALIREQLNKVWDRVQVGSRDLQLEYEKRQDEFNPPPEAHFRLIRVSSSDTQAVEAIAERFENEPFQDVADDERNQSKEPLVVAVPDGLENTQIFAIPELQTAATALAPGTFAGPIDSGTATRWVFLDRIETTSRSLYQVQLQLRDEITGARREEEAKRYLYRLFDRAGIRGIDELTLRLVDIAEMWYYEPGTR